MFGTTQLYVYCNPKEGDPFRYDVTYDQAQDELAAKSGFDMSLENKSRGRFQYTILYTALHVHTIVYAYTMWPSTNRVGIMAHLDEGKILIFRSVGYH